MSLANANETVPPLRGTLFHLSTACPTPLRYTNSVHQAALSFALWLAVCAQVRCFTMCFYSCGGSCNADEWPIVKRHEMSWILNNGHPWAMIHQVYQWINLKKSYALGRIENWDASGHLGSCRPPKLLPTTPCHIGADRKGSRFYIQPTKRHNNEKGHLHDFLLHICSFLWSVSSALLLGHKIRLCCNTSRLSLNYIETERRKKKRNLASWSSGKCGSHWSYHFLSSKRWTPRLCKQDLLGFA